ncbi:hypothetical protein FACS1894167_08510 [Synergistales bacterium]|nr:hypothetical protein FACS1894167_08510 [Synergistales bacterium]
MKSRKFVSLLVFSVFTVMLTVSSAWALDLELGHYTRAYLVNGKSDYNPTAKGASSPAYDWIYLESYISKAGEENLGGTITVNTSAAVTVQYEDGSDSEQITGERKFKFVWDGDYYYPAKIDGAGNSYAYFTSGAETGFSEQNITVSLGAVNETVAFSKISTTAQQLSGKCVPYLELITNGTKTTGVKWRFVDPGNPSVALKRAAGSDISLMYRIRIVDKSGRKYEVTPRVRPEAGGTLEGTVTFDESVNTGDIDFVRIGFEYGEGYWNAKDGIVNPYVFYQWRFYAIETEPGTGGNSGSGGGCSVGTVLFALPLAGLFLARLRKRG